VISQGEGDTIVTEDISANATQNGSFMIEVQLPAKRSFTAVIVDIDNIQSSNFVLDGGNIKVFPGNKIKVVGTLSDLTKDGKLKVYIDPPTIGKIVGIDILHAPPAPQPPPDDDEEDDEDEDDDDEDGEDEEDEEDCDDELAEHLCNDDFVEDDDSDDNEDHDHDEEDEDDDDDEDNEDDD